MLITCVAAAPITASAPESGDPVHQDLPNSSADKGMLQKMADNGTAVLGVVGAVFGRKGSAAEGGAAEGSAAEGSAAEDGAAEDGAVEDGAAEGLQNHQEVRCTTIEQQAAGFLLLLLVS